MVLFVAPTVNETCSEACTIRGRSALVMDDNTVACYTGSPVTLPNISHRELTITVTAQEKCGVCNQVYTLNPRHMGGSQLHTIRTLVVQLEVLLLVQ